MARALLLALVLLAVACALPTGGRLRFEAIGAGLPGAGQWRDGFDLVDLDRDGHLDLVHGPSRAVGADPLLLRGDGAGGFASWSGSGLPSGDLTYGDAATGDFDGDGDLDVAIGQHLHEPVVFESDGVGAFREAPLPAAALAFSTRALESVDWDGDGRDELLALGEGPLPGTGREPRGLLLLDWVPVEGWRAFLEHGAVGLPLPFGSSLAVGDVDGDGQPDAATASSSFGRRDVLVLGDGEWGGTRRELTALSSTGYVRAVALADFDGDGRDDLAASSVEWAEGEWWTRIDVLLSARGDVFASSVILREPGSAGLLALGAGDLDGDGHADLVAFDAEGEPRIFLGMGGGRLARARATGLSGDGCAGRHVRISDLDGDGRGEIVASFGEDPGVDPACVAGGSLRAWLLAAGSRLIGR